MNSITRAMLLKKVKEKFGTITNMSKKTRVTITLLSKLHSGKTLSRMCTIKICHALGLNSISLFQSVEDNSIR